MRSSRGLAPPDVTARLPRARFRRFPFAVRFFHQPPKEGDGERLARHALGMPLHAESPAWPGGPLQCLSDAVTRPRRDAQAASRLVRALMMRAVYPRARTARQLRELAALDTNRMQRLVSTRAAIMVQGVPNFAGNVLHKRAMQMNVQKLRAVADCQHRLATRQSVIQQPVIGALPSLIGMRILRVTNAAKTSRLDVGGTAGQNEPVE